MDPLQPEPFLARLAQNLAEHHPGKTIARVVVVSGKGSSQMHCTEGTGVGADVD